MLADSRAVLLIKPRVSKAPGEKETPESQLGETSTSSATEELIVAEVNSKAIYSYSLRAASF